MGANVELSVFWLVSVAGVDQQKTVTEMLAVRGLPSVPEEDLLPEVGGTAPDHPPPSIASSTTTTTANTGSQYPPRTPTTTTTGPQYPAPTTTTRPQYPPQPATTGPQYPPPPPTTTTTTTGLHFQSSSTSTTELQYQSSTTSTSVLQYQIPTPTTTTGLQYPSSTSTTFLPSPPHPHQQQYQQPLHHLHHHQQEQQVTASLPTQSPPLYPANQAVPLQAAAAATPPQVTAASHLQQLPSLTPLRSVGRSHSHHELTATQTGPVGGTSLGLSGQHDTFAVPKLVPRRRSHSSGGSSSSSSGGGGGGTGLAGSPSLAPHQVICALPNPAPAIKPPSTLPHIAPTPVIASVQASSTSSNSALLAQLLTSGPYHVSSSSGGHSLVTSGQLGGVKNEVKPLLIPGLMTGSASPPSTAITTNSNTVYTLSGDACTVKPVATTSIIMPPITLSAITPSSFKSQPFSQSIPPWSTPCSPPQLIKQSPPHPEPSSPLMISVPSPPNKAFRPKSDSERVQYKEHRRVCHINAEQKRRSNLKNNFDIMHQLIPSISQNANAKISKAVMLQKGAEYIQQLKGERQQLTEEAEKLKAQIESLSCEISNAQAQLPATGAPMTHARYSKLKEMFTTYVRERTLSNWKFWIFSLITEPLLESYNNSVSTSSLEELCRSSLAWLDQQCSLNNLRPLVSSSMRKLSTTTNVLADPDSLPEEVFHRVTKQESDRFHPR